MKIPFPLSRILGSIAEKAAADLGLAMAIAVVDREGLLQYFARMDGTLPASTELAMSKAYTAAALRMSTREVGQMALPGNPLYGIQHTHAGKIVLFGGGFPLRLQGEVEGGIGVSGGTVEEDEQVAQAALDSLGDMERLAQWIEPLVRDVARFGLRVAGWKGDWMVQLERRFDDVLREHGRPVDRELISVLAGAFIIASCS